MEIIYSNLENPKEKEMIMSVIRDEVRQNIEWKGMSFIQGQYTKLRTQASVLDKFYSETEMPDQDKTRAAKRLGMCVGRFEDIERHANRRAYRADPLLVSSLTYLSVTLEGMTETMNLSLKTAASKSSI